MLLRIEDHDRIRSRPEYEAALLEDLHWLGFAPAEPPVRQSEREGRYRAALEQLIRAGSIYPCDCSRRRIAENAARGPEVPGAETRYPGTCRERNVSPDTTPMRRLRLDRATIEFDDLALGPQRQTPAEQCGDLLLIDRDGHWTYQFAVVVDDLEQGIDLVVRGRDLLESTGRQIQLGRLLGRREPPRFLHHPLITHPDGTKLSKSNRDSGVRELRAAEWSAEAVRAEAARRGGFSSESLSAWLRR